MRWTILLAGLLVGLVLALAPLPSRSVEAAGCSSPTNGFVYDLLDGECLAAAWFGGNAAAATTATSSAAAANGGSDGLAFAKALNLHNRVSAGAFGPAAGAAAASGSSSAAAANSQGHAAAYGFAMTDDSLAFAGAFGSSAGGAAAANESSTAAAAASLDGGGAFGLAANQDSVSIAFSLNGFDWGHSLSFWSFNGF